MKTCFSSKIISSNRKDFGHCVRGPQSDRCDKLILMLWFRFWGITEFGPEPPHIKKKRLTPSNLIDKLQKPGNTMKARSLDKLEQWNLPNFSCILS